MGQKWEEGLLRLITVKQAEYRAYIASPVWKAKRGEALAFYGCICNKCCGWGNEVHHKTYERVGGNEKMEDLEVLCRECHEAHHRNHDKRTRRKNPGIHRNAIWKRLKPHQREMVQALYPDESIYSAILLGNPYVANYAAKVLGYRYAYGPGMNLYTPKCVRHHLSEVDNPYGFTKEFKKFSQLPKIFS